MNPTLRERLIRSEQRFLLAVASNDEESLEVFFQEWSQLARDIENTKAAGPLDDITAHLLSEVSHAIENMTVCMLESGSILQESLAHPISDFIQEIPPIGPSRHTQAIAPYHLIFSNLSSSMAPTILGRQKLLDSYAYCWLMQNVHDPYPNCMQMQIISDVSGASTTQVDLWFQEARDSIGWNKLARDYFAGSVNATVTSARRVFLERDKSFLFDVVFAFTTVKANAEMLFLENPCLQGKNVDMGPALGIRTMGSDQDHHMGSFTGEPILDLEGILVPSQVNRLAPPDPLSDLSDSNESEEEDTTPPPSIVGCKRPLAEDVLTSQVAGLGRPQKRRRTWCINWTPSSEQDCSPPLSSTMGLSSEQTIPYISAAPLSSFSSFHPLSPTSPVSSPVPTPSISQKRGDTLEVAVGSIRTGVSVHGSRKRRLSQCVSPPLSKRQCRPSILSGANPILPFDECRGSPTEPDEFLQPTLQVLVGSDVPINPCVYDWNSIPDPFSGTGSSLSQPPVVYVPSSDLASQLPEPPDLGHDAKIMSSLSSDLGSLEDLNSLLQFPIPVGPPPDLSTSFAASSYSADPSLILQDLDLSTITEFINLLPPGSIQGSSPLTSSSGPPTPPEDSHLSLPPSHLCHSSEQLLFELDSLVPPSAFLPIGSGDFSEDVDNMWSLLRGDS